MVGLTFTQNGDFDVAVGKFDAKTLEQHRSDVIVETKNGKKSGFKTRLSQPIDLV